ncbi:hypothetical protein BD626DRAFT_485826 [Schizophyllum amplum]|uniref:Uncharacterized protein n=1 Tax=Schizophyllum amplum TaxID=97359 RepID=A0A550CLV3_9AGAR|nr:hypothetical protein BD626DRAFT_485826 [Auriculariopsis ampla]
MHAVSSSQPATAQGSLAAPDAIHPSASQDTAFTPRKEFLRLPKQVPNSFSLLAISASNCIRLYSFPLSFIVALRRLLEQQSSIVTYREDVQNNMCEFVLDGKPWSNTKSVTTERLLVHILVAIYQHGYTFLSVIDYGRESDDKLAMAFSKPSSPPVSHAGSPRPSQDVRPDAASVSSHSMRERRVPFALSFASATCMRVIAPPLHCTPAILQAVRGSWPRGVVSEKKVSDDCFEFKLKGYRWFQEDTFATDSLRHILSLLSALDANSFTLLASISLTNRSRVKDLWVFTGPPSPSAVYADSPDASMVGSHLDMRRAPNQSYQNLPPTGMHRRMATEPAGPTFPQPTHHRAVTELTPRRTLSKNRRPHTPSREATPPGAETSPSTLRKPAPRAQVPVSVASITDVEEEGFRAQLPSHVPSGIENMTGIGAGPPQAGGPLPPQIAMPMPLAEQTPDVFYSTSPFTAGAPPQASPIRSTHDGPSALLAHEVPVQTIEELSAGSLTPTPPGTQAGTPPLLSPGVFRDSAFSSNTDMSAEVPIKWTGIAARLEEEPSVMRPSMGERVRSEDDPHLPGAWQPTPAEEEYAELRPDSGVGRDESPAREVQEVHGRVSSPEMMQPDVFRKSEAGLIEIASRRQTRGEGSPDSPPRSSGEGSPTAATARPGAPKTRSGHTSVRGWVLVNVEPVSPKSEAAKELGKNPKGKENDGAETKEGAKDKGRESDSAASSIRSSMATKHKKGTSAARRLFSLTRRGSKPKSEDAAKSRTSFRDRLKSVGTDKLDDHDDA